MAKGNKYYSDRQEKSVARYLGWKQVIGSGSRPHHVGDVVGRNWVGECKTHTTPGHKIIFRFDIWDKLENEAMSIFRDPVLIVDDGSQQIENTFVLLKLQFVPGVQDSRDYSNKSSVILPDISQCKVDHVVVNFTRNGQYFIVLWLPTFRRLLEYEQRL